MRHILRLVLLSVLIPGAATVSAAAPAASPEPPPLTNVMCPVMPEERASPDFSAQHEGRTVYFCCARCRRTFLRDPTPYLAALRPPTDAHDHDHDRNAHVHDDHDHHHGEMPHVLHWLGKFHPLSVHLPIGLLIGAALAEQLGLLTRRRWFRDAARFCIWSGAAGALLAAPLGWFNAGWEITHDDWILGTHRWLGTTVFAWSIMLVVLVEFARRRPETRWPALYLAALFIGAILIATTGHYGGMLVHGTDYYQW